VKNPLKYKYTHIHVKCDARITENAHTRRKCVYTRKMRIYIENAQIHRKYSYTRKCAFTQKMLRYTLKKPSPPLLSGFKIKNPEEEDPPRRTTPKID